MPGRRLAPVVALGEPAGPPSASRVPEAGPEATAIGEADRTGPTFDHGATSGKGAAVRPARVSSPTTASRSEAPSLGWAGGLALAWIAGAVACLIPLLVGRLGLRRLESRAERPDDDSLSKTVEALAAGLGVSRRVRVLLGDDDASPMTWGSLRPVILLPAGAGRWPAERLRDVLRHELAHVRRWDYATQAVARLAFAVYWFHPLAWLAASRLRGEAERACDDLVLESGSRASDYAGHLLAVARGLRPSPRLAAAAVPMARASQLEGRLAAILDHSRRRRGPGRRGAFVMLATALGRAAAAVVGEARRRGLADDPKTSPEVKAPADAGETMAVSGRVLDPEGKAVPGTKVAIVGRRKQALLNARADDQRRTLGRGVADADGRFRLSVPRTSSLTYYEAHAVAAAPGFGLAWSELNRDAEAPSADVRLRSEQVIERRLVDLQGGPAAGVKVRVSNVGVAKPEVGGFDGLHIWKRTREGLAAVWPAPVETDADGRFALKGIGPGVQVGLSVNDRRFARQGMRLTAEAKPAALPLQPALRVSGRVTCADTGEPLRDAVVMVGSGGDQLGSGESEYRTDADGRYEANPAPGKFLKVTVYPPIGSPYLIYERNFDDAEGAARREVDLAVPRGVLITGRVAERGGRPLAGASIFYEDGGTNVVEGRGTIPGWMAAVPSGADGHYAIAVKPGKGRLVVYGPSADYAHEVLGANRVDGGQPGGRRLYAHSFVPYEVKAGPEPVVKDVDLRPGATLIGRVEGPDGQTVEKAEIVTTLSISPFHTAWRGDFTIPVREGRFELHGVPADRPVKCSFLDAEERLGGDDRGDGRDGGEGAADGPPGPGRVGESPDRECAREAGGEGGPGPAHRRHARPRGDRLRRRDADRPGAQAALGRRGDLCQRRPPELLEGAAGRRRRPDHAAEADPGRDLSHLRIHARSGPGGLPLARLHRRARRDDRPGRRANQGRLRTERGDERLRRRSGRRRKDGLDEQPMRREPATS